MSVEMSLNGLFQFKSAVVGGKCEDRKSVV